LETQMKISDLDNDITGLNEAPVSGFKQGLRRLGAAALGTIGATDTASNIAGKADVGDKANQMYTKYNRYLGRQNSSINDSTAGDLKDFLASINVDDKYVANPDTEVLTKAELNDVFLQIAKDSFRQARAQSDTGVGGVSPGGGPSTPGAPAPRSGGNNLLAQIQKDVARLSNDEKTQLITYLQKSVKQSPRDTRIEPTLGKPADNVVQMRARA
jgi:hypothetical protein